MPKIKIKAKTFNGLEIEPTIDVFINYGKKDKNLPLWVYDNIKKEVKNKFKVKNFDFEIISKDLEIFKENGIEILWEEFIKNILPLMENIDKEIENAALKRAYYFYKEGKINEAKEIFDLINEKELSEFDKKEFKFITFLLDTEKNEKKFKEYVKFFKDNPVKLKEIYFNFIKTLQDKRDEKLPKRFIEEFENKFSLNYLNDKEKSIYFYLKGRGFYYRGEFIDAIRNLKEAKKYAIDEELLSNVYNTTANIFTDNLYFEEALNLANKALEIRKKLHLYEKVNDTLSLIGGIYLKQKKLNKAYKCFKEVKRKDSRINNYKAKTALLRGFLNKAKEYIEKSREFELKEENYDEKGFLRSIEMLYLFKKKEFEKTKEFFKNEFVLPEKREKVDAIVWGLVYSIMSEMYFLENKKEDVFKSLFMGVKNLLNDNYILEAYYLSLYPYKFKMAKQDIDEFNKKISIFNLKSELSDYVYRHTEILYKEAESFDLVIEKENLKEFYEKLISVEDVFNKYNLF